MASDVRYRETLRMQPWTFLRLVGVFTLVATPLAVFLWFTWRPLGTALVLVLVAAFSVTFWLTNWQIQVRSDGLYYRVVPFFPVWRSLADAGDVTDVTVEAETNGRQTLDDEGALFPRSSGIRTVAVAIDGGVRVERTGDTDVFVSSHSPTEFASAMRAVAF